MFSTIAARWPPPLTGAGRTGLFAHPGWWRLRPRGVHVFSDRNDNQRFTAWIGLQRRWDGDVRLELGTGEHSEQNTVIGGVGYDSAGSFAIFALDARQARAAAGLFGVPLRERAAIAQAVRASWSIAPPAVLVLRLDNPAESVHVWTSGLPALTSLSHAVFRDGVALSAAPRGCYTGPVVRATLGPGSPLEIREDLAESYAFDPGGAFEVRCSYRGQALPVDVDGAAYPARAHERWDLAFDGTLRFTVAG